jgi:ferrous iron transport protein B
MFKAALVGNPNSGKTSLFNELTGSSQYVGNWPGVTVEKKEGRLKGNGDIIIVDLPGIYSLSPYTPEEIISRNFIINEKPDVIINIVDASNIERNLYLTLQLLETGLPVIIALNMIDVVNKKGDRIDASKLSSLLNCAVTETSAVKGTGLKEIIQNIIKIKKGSAVSPKLPFYENNFSETINRICGEIRDAAPFAPFWHAVKLFEKDKLVQKELKLNSSAKENIEKYISQCEKIYDDDCESIVTDVRYRYIDDVLKQVYVKKSKETDSISEKIDAVVTNRFLAIPIFLAVIWAIYFIAIQTVGATTSDWMRTLFSDIIGESVRAFLARANAAEWLSGFIVDGIINGVGAVLVFVPQLMILFLCLSFLEDCGYMSRVAFIMDRIFRSFGLSGKSFIPMIIGTGCSVPGIMASRTIENEKNRKMTIMLTPFIPCSAKLPVFALIAGAVFPRYSFVAPSMYFVGIAAVIISGLLLKKLKVFSENFTPFVMELPRYMLPTLKNITIHMWQRVKDFIRKAGTIIFALSGLIWALAYFDFAFNAVPADRSMLAQIGGVIAPLFAPLGFGNWQISVAALSGYAAKENIVATLGIVLGMGSGMSLDNPLMLTEISKLFYNPAAGYAFMTFILLAPPCVAAISAIKREMGSLKWTFAALGFQLLVSYLAAFIIFQTGSMIFYGGSPLTTAVLAAALFSLIAYTVYKKIRNFGKCGSCSACAYKENCDKKDK